MVPIFGAFKTLLNIGNTKVKLCLGYFYTLKQVLVDTALMRS